MAMASENSARGQPNSPAMGIWNSPKLARMPKFTRRMTQPATITGVKSVARAAGIGGALRGIGLEGDTGASPGGQSNQ